MFSVIRYISLRSFFESISPSCWNTDSSFFIWFSFFASMNCSFFIINYLYKKLFVNMIIWFFDSWLWWKLVMEVFQKQFPDILMILEMDRKHAPYWDKEQEEIRLLTKNWVQRLFDRWADVVILACNTASVHALRWLQQEIYPWKHILGVTVPGAEAVVEWWYKKSECLQLKQQSELECIKNEYIFLMILFLSRKFLPRDLYHLLRRELQNDVK